MKSSGGILVLVAAMTLIALPRPGQAAVDGVVLDEVRTVWGIPYDVSLETTREGVTVTGKVRASLANNSRRMYGHVWAELVDRSGDTIAVLYTDPRRMDTARHTHRARFAIEIGQLPEDVAEIRVGYR